VTTLVLDNVALAVAAGKVAPSRSEPQVIDGLLTAQQLWAQAEAAGISYDSLTNGQADLGAALSKSQHLQGGSAGGGSSSAPMHLRLGSMGSAGRQSLPPPHTQHSALGVTGANAAQCECLLRVKSLVSFSLSEPDSSPCQTDLVSCHCHWPLFLQRIVCIRITLARL
jgi:hypothetical protein